MVKIVVFGAVFELGKAIAQRLVELHQKEDRMIGIVRANMDAVARQAEADWYGPAGVERRTGQSGQMEVTTTIDARRGVIRVTVGSSDPRRVGKKALAPAAYVHRPGPNPVALRVVT